MLTTKSVSKPKSRSTKDALSIERSKRHGEATKRGIKRAKKAQYAVLKAASMSRGLSKHEVAQKLFEPKRSRPHTHTHPEKEGAEGAASPSLCYRISDDQ